MSQGSYRSARTRIATALRRFGVPSLQGGRASSHGSSTLGLSAGLPGLLAAGLALGALLALAALLGLRGAAPAAAASDPCSNAEFRTGHSADLPDCRAYEMVSPLQSDPFFLTSARAAASGDRLSYFSYVIPPNVETFGNFFLSSRGAEGWSTEGVIPPMSTMNANLCIPAIVFWSADFSRGLLSAGYHSFKQGCGQDDPPLVEGRPDLVQNLFVRDGSTSPPTYQLVNPTPEDVEPAHALPQAATPDLSYVAFNSDAPLTPGATRAETRFNPPDNLYVWHEGTLRLATVLPDGTATHGRIANAQSQTFGVSGGANYTNALAADGSRIYFQAEGNLYVRENPTQEQSPLDETTGACTDPALACTIQIDAPQGGSGPGGEGDFLWASTDGSVGYFTAPAGSGLTADTQTGSGQNLYRYEAETGALTNLTAAADARVLGMSGTSADGSVAYFAAEGALAPGATAGEPNLYRLEGGTTSLVATLSSAFDGVRIASRFVPHEACNWTAGCMTARVSSDGRYTAFNSVASLTGHDNVPEDPEACKDVSAQPSGFPCAQVFRYDAATDDLSCASCNPSGTPPTGHTWFERPSGIVQLNQKLPAYLRRNLSADGEVFFESPDALVARDSNGHPDVYQYTDGELSLISTGTAESPRGSHLVDASASGDDVFVATELGLVSGDTDAGVSIYDARVGGGLPQPAVPVPCEGDGCQGDPSAAPDEEQIGSGDFAGPGNLDPRCQLLADRARLVWQSARGLMQRARALWSRAKQADDPRRARRLGLRARRLATAARSRADRARDLAQRARRCRDEQEAGR